MDHHRTQVPFIYGYVDENDISIRGWLINIRMRSSVNANLFRAIQEKNQEQLTFNYGLPRADVRDVYKLLSEQCGFSITRTDPSSPIHIQMFMFDEWKTVMTIADCPAPKLPPPPIVQPAPTPVASPVASAAGHDTLSSNTALHRDVIVVDEFYENPDIVRQMALRGDTRIPLNDLKVFLEKIVGGKIVSIEDPGFQFHIAENLTSVTGDTKQHTYCANVFLTPEAPVSAGITLYRSKDTGKRTFAPEVHTKISRDLTRFEPIDKVGNVYNRLAVWNANLLHGASCYFGDSKENGRLVQSFKFTTVYV
jgi:hypothetical protein